MSAEQYLLNVVLSKKAPSLTLDDWRLSTIKRIVTEWAGSQLSEIKQSGSSAKGTAVHGIADFDIFISLKSNTSATLKDLHSNLSTYIASKGIATKKQNVAIGVEQYGLSIDLVPAKVQSGYVNYHSIYSSKKDSWMQTNIDLHISKIRNSGRTNEIILTKIWRHIHGLDFPSMYLELIVLEALTYKPSNNLENNFWSVLTYLRDSFPSKVIIDPANTNNTI